MILCYTWKKAKHLPVAGSYTGSEYFVPLPWTRAPPQKFRASFTTRLPVETLWNSGSERSGVWAILYCSQRKCWLLECRLLVQSEKVQQLLQCITVEHFVLPVIWDTLAQDNIHSPGSFLFTWSTWSSCRRTPLSSHSLACHASAGCG